MFRDQTECCYQVIGSALATAAKTLGSRSRRKSLFTVAELMLSNLTLILHLVRQVI